jgi:hypothetical protein
MLGSGVICGGEPAVAVASYPPQSSF